MIDMSAVIIPKSDQINADDLISGPISVTIQAVAITPGTEQPVSIDIGVPGKVYRPCKSMSRVLVSAWGPDAKAYTGRSMTLYRDPTVKWGGMDVGGIRISHLSHIEKDMTMALTATRATRKPYTVHVLKASNPTASTSTPAQHAPTPQDDATLNEEIDPALQDYADLLDAEIDGWANEDTSAKFNATMKGDDQWAALRQADPARAQALKDKAMAKAKAGKVATNA